MKIILYAVTIYTGYIPAEGRSLAVLLIHAVCLTLIGAAGFITWATVGGILQNFFQKHGRLFNIAMAVVLIWCAISLVIEG